MERRRTNTQRRVGFESRPAHCSPDLVVLIRGVLIVQHHRIAQCPAKEISSTQRMSRVVTRRMIPMGTSVRSSPSPTIRSAGMRRGGGRSSAQRSGKEITLTLDITKGERDVLFRLAQGYERSDIAASLDVSVSTVNGRLYDAQRRNSLRNVNHLLAVFVGETVLAAARAQEGPEDEG